MSGFYGNTTDTRRIQFYFDKIYPNKKALKNFADKDNVYINRHVLIEYSTDPFDDRYGEYFFNIDNPNQEILNQSKKDTIGYKIREVTFTIPGNEEEKLPEKKVTAKEISLYYFNQERGWEGKTKEEPFGKPFYIYDPSEPKNFNDPIEEIYQKLNYMIDRKCYTQDDFFQNNGDEETYRGWDSTVWQKIYIGEKEVDEKGNAYEVGKEDYISIAELNAIAPKFELVYDPPGANNANQNGTYANPYIDFDLSTPLNYKIRVQPAWDFSVDKINYNKAGFDKKIKSYVKNSEDKFLIKPISGTKKIYSKPGQDTEKNPTLTKGLDTYQLTVDLPSIGNTISDFWDIVYGVNSDGTRDTTFSWDDKIENQKKGFNFNASNSIYKPEDFSNLANCFRGFYNLFGYEIKNEKLPIINSNTSQDKINEYLSNIYYDQQKYYYLALTHVGESNKYEWEWLPLSVTSIIQIILEINKLMGKNDSTNNNPKTIFGAINLSNWATEESKKQTALCKTATEESKTQTGLCKTATEESKKQTALCKTATEESREQTALCNTATKNANIATKNANTATENSIKQTGLCETATKDANTATENANTAASSVINVVDRAEKLMGENTPDNRDPNTIHGCLNIAQNAQHDYTKIVKHATTLIGQPTDQTFDTLEGAQNLAEQLIKDTNIAKQETIKATEEAIKASNSITDIRNNVDNIKQTADQAKQTADQALNMANNAKIYWELF